MLAWVGRYPRGFEAAALSELATLCYDVVEHHPEHCLLIWHADLSNPYPHCCSEVMQLIAPLMFEPHFKTELARGPKIAFRSRKRAFDDDAFIAAKNVVERLVQSTNVDLYALISRPWRATCEHLGEHNFRYDLLARHLGYCIGAHLDAASSGDRVPVSLDAYELEVVLTVSDGVDTLLPSMQRPAADTDVFCLTLRRAMHTTGFHIDKGDSVKSKGNDAVASCVAWAVLRLLTASQIIVCDPMCGVGTYPFALQALTRSMTSLGRQIIGCDQHGPSIEVAATYAPPGVMLFLGDTARLPFGSESIDGIVCDPPWGLRHSTYNAVNRNSRPWISEWCRVLRVGGILAVVTIRTKLFEQEVAEFPALRPIKQIQFDNCGHTQCRLFMFEKTV
eukprot:GEMP01055360.1.p1 GENE.GEMP01055360.1~~GEMP01055360.1.p1  ORF type:complete len:391 (+),score=91.78 GEMP01055360.1:77-1249(+)